MYACVCVLEVHLNPLVVSCQLGWMDGNKHICIVVLGGGGSFLHVYIIIIIII